MKCSGFGRNVNACFKTAGELCPNGYDIVDRSSGTQAMMFRGTLMAAPWGGKSQGLTQLVSP